jgi:hypothetical protein
VLVGINVPAASAVAQTSFEFYQSTRLLVS